MAEDILEQSTAESVYTLLRAWDGHRPTIHLTREQALKAAYIVAARRPCYLCGGQTAVVGKLTLPSLVQHHGGKLFLFGLCEACRDNPASNNLVLKCLLEDCESGLPDPLEN